MAVGVCGRVSERTWDIDHSALRNLYRVRGLYGARPDRYCSFISDYAVSLIDGLRPRDGRNAAIANGTYAALVFTICKGGGSSISFDPSGLHVSGDMSYFWSLASLASLVLYAAGDVRRCRDARFCWFVFVGLR